MTIKSSCTTCYQFMHSLWHLITGTRRLRAIKKPIITFFGGGLIAQDSFYSRQSAALAQRLIQHDFFILTGGGAGIMEGASCAVPEYTLGIRVHGLVDKYTQECGPYITVNNFFVRKYMLINYSVGFVVFPGGVGTLDELFELLNMRQQKFIPLYPLILVGSAYWQPLLNLLQDDFKQGYVLPDLEKLFVVTDDLEVVVKAMVENAKC